MANENAQSVRGASVLLFVFGLLLLLVGLLANDFVLNRLDANPPIAPRAAERLHAVQIIMVLSGLLLLALAQILRPGRCQRVLQSWMSRELAVRILLMLLTLLVPLYILEVGLRPWAQFKPKRTTLFIKDENLGWKLKPGTRDYWGGTIVQINAKGLRGQEIPYARLPGRVRILCLGDSVTFGYQLKTYEETFPFRTAERLTEALGGTVEAINAGVGGYSQWQQLVFLRNEGLRYAPDLVVIAFVLNDVTEKMDLAQFGGTGEGSQLLQSYHSFYDWLSNNSAIVNVLDRLKARRRFGENVREGAVREETLRVESLVTDPAQPRIEWAWDLTIADLEGIFSCCRENSLPVLLMVLPYAFQLEPPERPPVPQDRLRVIAAQHNVPILDLLPPFRQWIADQGLAGRDLFLDENHLSAAGSDVTSRLLADFILTHRAELLPTQGSATTARRN